MAAFLATMTYELAADAAPEARKLLRAELVGRRWRDTVDDARMPAQTVWARRDVPEEQTTDDVHAACGADLRSAVAAVARAGLAIRLVRAWVHVSGAGTFGLVRDAEA